MRMTLEHTGIRYAHELGIMQRHDILGTAIAHTGTETAYKLVDYLV